MITTKRLGLRPFTLDDAPFIVALLNEPAFISNIGDKGVRSLKDAQDYLRDGPLASQARYGFALWRVALREHATPIGMAGLVKRHYLEDVDLGYALLSAYHGAGYAFEAATAVMRYARDSLGLRRIAAIVNEYNAPSIGLLGKLGFTAAGRVTVPGQDQTIPIYEAHW